MHLEAGKELRTVTLAQALGGPTPEHTLVSQIQMGRGTAQALAAANAARSVGVAEWCWSDRRRRRRPPGATPAWPRCNGGRLLWLARGLPLLALLLGLLLDRIANATGWICSAPLLAVLGWNLVIYAVLAWRTGARARPLLAALQ